MSKLREDSAFSACLALPFATLATASTVLALFHPGSIPLAGSCRGAEAGRSEPSWAAHARMA